MLTVCAQRASPKVLLPFVFKKSLLKVVMATGHIKLEELSLILLLVLSCLGCARGQGGCHSRLRNKKL